MCLIYVKIETCLIRGVTRNKRIKPAYTPISIIRPIRNLTSFLRLSQVRTPTHSWITTYHILLGHWDCTIQWERHTVMKAVPVPCTRNKERIRWKRRQHLRHSNKALWYVGRRTIASSTNDTCRLRTAWNLSFSFLSRFFQCACGWEQRHSMTLALTQTQTSNIVGGA